MVKYNLHLCANEKLPAVARHVSPQCAYSSLSHQQFTCFAPVEVILEICNRDKSILGHREDQSNQRDRKLCELILPGTWPRGLAVQIGKLFPTWILQITLIFGGDEGIYP